MSARCRRQASGRILIGRPAQSYIRTSHQRATRKADGNVTAVSLGAPVEPTQWSCTRASYGLFDTSEGATPAGNLRMDATIEFTGAR